MKLGQFSDKGYLRKIGSNRGVHTEAISLDVSFLDVAGKFAHLPGTVALVSGTDLDSARYHMLAVLPWMTLSGVGQGLTLCIGEEMFPVEEAPFEVVASLLQHLRLPSPAGPLPVAAGLFGYFSYDLKDQLETLPRTSIDDLGLPQIWLSAPGALLVHDRREGISRFCIPEREGVDTGRVRREFFNILEAPDVDVSSESVPPNQSASRRSNFTRQGYLDAVGAVKEYIAQGDVYQVNISQRFQTSFSGDAWELFRALFQQNPAPFFAYIQAGDHQIVSTSPERFLQQNGLHVETRPIKGTAPRGKTPEADAQFREALLQSRKDDAELSMIVDLLRNDIGKVCEGGSVRVTEHKRLESYQNVYHLVSTVEGTLASGQSSVDLLCATFPGGSITGCPKIRAMEIIDELESHRRHVYTGSIGYISFHDTMDLSIAIRTATVVGGELLFSVGGGIVIDSDPAAEFEETLHKGQTLSALCGGEGGAVDARSWVWQNGHLAPMSEASILVSDLGVQYGFGFFETIRVDDGRARHLDAHVQRFSTTWRRLFSRPVPDLSWPEVIRQVTAANNLDSRVAAVKILATFGTRTAPPWDHQVVVSARPYIHRLAGKKTAGLRLATYEASRQTPLADFKTTNYLFYHLAGDWARENGADEALILNPDGSISETNSANILLIQGRTVRVPVSSHVLPGVMQEAVCSVLTEFGYKVESHMLMSGALCKADMVLCTNALMGAVPVLSLDGRDLCHQAELCNRINAVVL